MEIAVSFSLPDATNAAAVQALCDELTDFIMACTKVMGTAATPTMRFSYPKQQMQLSLPASASLPGGVARVPLLGRIT